MYGSSVECGLEFANRTGAPGFGRNDVVRKIGTETTRGRHLKVKRDAKCEEITLHRWSKTRCVSGSIRIAVAHSDKGQ